MGLFDLSRMGKVLAHTARAVRSQRDLARELAALPMPTFVPQRKVVQWMEHVSEEPYRAGTR